MCEVAERDVVPVIARQAAVLYEERSWLEALSVDDVATRTNRRGLSPTS